MSDRVDFARVTPVLASVLGSALLVVFWACCLLGPAMLVCFAALALGAEAAVAAMFALLGLAATIIALKGAVHHPGVWRGM